MNYRALFKVFDVLSIPLHFGTVLTISIILFHTGCTDGDIRLIGGRSSEKFSEGRVEICSNGVWGTVYDEGNWDSRDAIVVCRQLGYQG